MIRTSTTKSPGFLERRRARQRRGDAGRSYSFELAALHLELLVAMAAVDDEVRSIEVEEVLGFIDRTSLPADDITRLEELARASLANPTQIQVLAGMLSNFAGKPALARALVEDLARVAGADSQADPREVTLLEFVCDALHVERAAIDDSGSTPTAGAHAPRQPRAPKLAAQHRRRAAVRAALDASYVARDQSSPS